MVAMNHPSSAKLALIKLANTGFLTENPARRRMANRPVRGGQLVQRYGHAGRNAGRAHRGHDREHHGDRAEAEHDGAVARAHERSHRRLFGL